MLPLTAKEAVALGVAPVVLLGVGVLVVVIEEEVVALGVPVMLPEDEKECVTVGEAS